VCDEQQQRDDVEEPQQRDRQHVGHEPAEARPLKDPDENVGGQYREEDG
jgi:hypothetical protein